VTPEPPDAVRSIHDSNVYAYFVACDQRRITLYTEYKAGPAPIFTDVVFEGVRAHHFRDVRDGNILFDIEEVDAEWLLKNESDDVLALMPYLRKPASCPGPSAFPTVIREDGLRIFAIGTSYGLDGWVIGTGMRLVARDSRHGS
jgi:hypothetical protein